MSAPVNAGPFHEDFSWLPDTLEHDVSARFAAKVRTAASGCMAIARIAEQHMIDANTEQRPLLSNGHMHSLLCLIAPLMEMIDDAADGQIHWLASEASKGYRK